MKAIKASEKEIQDSILEYLKMRGVFCWRQNTGGMAGEHKGKKWFVRFGYPGVADIIGILPQKCLLTPHDDIVSCGRIAGTFLAIEVKRPGAKQADSQIEFQRQVETHGGIYILATSVDEVRRALGDGNV